jgi:hypothetical protein
MSNDIDLILDTPGEKPFHEIFHRDMVLTTDHRCASNGSEPDKTPFRNFLNTDHQRGTQTVTPKNL